MILEIELEGARQVRQTFPEALQVFVLPPSLAELEHRIRQRGQDSEAAIARRLHRARWKSRPPLNLMSKSLTITWSLPCSNWSRWSFRPQ